MFTAITLSFSIPVFAILLALLFVKHFVADALLQTPYQYLNKGNVRHPGGYVHALIHIIGSFTSFMAWSFVFIFGYLFFSGVSNFVGVSIYSIILNFTIASLILSLVDGVVHYIIDWSKVNLTKKYKWSGFSTDQNGRECLNIYSNNFFIALVADQVLHFLTYLAIGVLFTVMV